MENASRRLELGVYRQTIVEVLGPHDFTVRE